MMPSHPLRLYNMIHHQLTPSRLRLVPRSSRTSQIAYQTRAQLILPTTWEGEYSCVFVTWVRRIVDIGHVRLLDRHGPAHVAPIQYSVLLEIL